MNQNNNICMKLCAVAECAQVVLTPIADETGDCENSHGFLPANEYGKMPFYAIMTAATVVVFLLWSLLCIRWWKVLFNIHLIIGSLCFLAILESVAWFVYLFSWNEGGLESKALFPG